MSQIQIRDALLGQAITTLTPLVGSNIAYENHDFDPEGLDKWALFSFHPVTSESTGKTSASSDYEAGFVQISVLVKLNSDSYDTEQLTIIDAIKKDFFFGVTIGGVSIEDVTLNNGYHSDAFYKRDVTINYKSFQSRG